MKSFRQLKNESRGIEPAPAPLVASGNPNVLKEAAERKKGGRVKVHRKAVEMSGKPVRTRADRPRRANGGQLQAPASGVGGSPYQIGSNPWGLASGGTTKRRRSENIREGDSIRPRATMED